MLGESNFLETLLMFEAPYVNYLKYGLTSKVNDELKQATLRVAVMYCELGLFAVEAARTDIIDAALRVIEQFSKCELLFNALAIDSNVNLLHCVIAVTCSLIEFCEYQTASISFEVLTANAHDLFPCS